MGRGSSLLATDDEYYNYNKTVEQKRTKRTKAYMKQKVSAREPQETKGEREGKNGLKVGEVDTNGQKKNIYLLEWSQGLNKKA